MRVLLVVLLAACCYAAPQKDDGSHVYDAETECFVDHPSINRDFIEAIKQAKKLPENPTDEFKCFLACVGKKIEVMSHQGDLHFDNLKQTTVLITGGHASHDDAHGIVSKCIEVDHDDTCEKAYQYVLCKIDELQPYKFSKGFCPTCQ